MYLAKAARVALRSTMTHRHGCIIVHSDGTILYDGYNHHDLPLNHKFSIHAEIDALYKAKRQKQRLTDCEMYVVRIGYDGLKYSKPCPSCASEIEKCGIRKVYYSVKE